MRFSPKPWLAVIAMTVSVTLLGLYAQHEARARPQALQAVRLQQLEHGGNVYLLTRDGRPVGAANIAYERLGDSIRVREETQLRLPAPNGMLQAAEQTTETVLDRQLRLTRFHVRLVSGGDSATQQRTVVDGIRLTPTDDSLTVTLHTGDGTFQQRLAAGPEVTLGSSLWIKLALSGALTEGARLGFREFDPTTLKTRPMAIDVGQAVIAGGDAAGAAVGRERHYPVRQMLSGMRYELVVSDRGLPVSATLPLGLQIEEGTVDQVLALRRAWAEADRGGRVIADPADVTRASVLAASAIQAGRRIANARTLTDLVVDARGLDALPTGTSGGAQEVQGTRIHVRALPLPRPGTAGYTLTGIGSHAPEVDIPALASALSVEPFIEVTQSAIVATARRVVGRTRDPVVATRRITAFVYRRLVKRYTVSIPSAVEVLRSGQGDCKHHTVLSVALLRAAGIPARPVAGLAYLDGAFYFHAWTEVWLGGRWVPIDATFGQAPADAARIRFFLGDDVGNALALSTALKLSIVSSR